MLKNIKNFFLISFILTVLCNQVFAANASSTYITSDAIVREIEKTLLFDKDSREKIDFYKTKTRKSDISFGQDKKDDSAPNPDVDIIVFEPKSQNSAIREKEKLAYNASVVGQYEVAIELYKKVLIAEPKNTYAKFALAVVYQKIGQYRQAKVLYADLLKEETTNKEEIIGNVLAIMVEETPKDTVYLLSRLAAQNPESSYVLAQAAIACDKIKDFEQAISFLKRAIELEPERLDYKYNLAVIYDKTSDFENALVFYSEVSKNYHEGDTTIPIEQVNHRVESIRSK